ncbi:ROK family protein [Microbacterium sp. 4R-513]|uniref:ROK family transcriptional regulator n=1 Tax=Microbacterium sp. 4R-513 TaxID=2567934 RepID=UPI0013E1F1B6|nr:ROK family transcriptional regulator [Microbacterium sp. 4R-513]QIG38672.1 ROK family protein [Microbacterium sp. 4R-513]
MLTDSEKALARAVLIHGPISRSALTSRLNLSPASLTRLAKPFLDRGFLIELDDSADGSVGRPVRPLDISPGLGRFVGVKITGEALHVVTTDARAALLDARSVSLTSTEPAAVAMQIRDSISSERPPGVGVSLGGSVRGSVAEFSPFLGWEEVPFGAILEDLVGVPVTLENDLVALTEAERWFGLGRGIPGFTVLTIGAGIGYGLVVNGEVVRSRQAGVGLAGHLPLSANGPVCQLGHRGCAQAMLTSGSIAAQVSASVQRPVDYGEALALAAAGDPAARTVVDAAADALGRFVALAANLSLQPASVLAGEGMGLFAAAEERVRAAIDADRDPRADPIELYVDETGFTAWARGAAAVAIQAAVDRIRLD